MEESTQIANVDDRMAAMVRTEKESSFAEYAAQRDKWMSTPIAHNTTLARGGYLFTIFDCAERTFEATALDESRGYKIGDPVEKIAYLCVSQQEWWFYSTQGEDVCYAKGEPFVILFNVNTVRVNDLARITATIKEEGPIYNVCLQEFPNRTKGFNPSHGLVMASQWKSLV